MSTKSTPSFTETMINKNNQKNQENRWKNTQNPTYNKTVQCCDLTLKESTFYGLAKTHKSNII